MAGSIGQSRIPSMSVFGEKPTTSAVVLLEPSTGRWAVSTNRSDNHACALESNFRNLRRRFGIIWWNMVFGGTETIEDLLDQFWNWPLLNRLISLEFRWIEQP